MILNEFDKPLKAFNSALKEPTAKEAFNLIGILFASAVTQIVTLSLSLKTLPAWTIGRILSVFIFPNLVLMISVPRKRNLNGNDLESKSSVNIENIKAGIYFVHISDEQGNTWVERIIKK